MWNHRFDERQNMRRTDIKRIVLMLGMFVVPITTQAAPILPTSYDMLNGESGTFTYHDETYNGSGSTTTDLAPLSGGVGDLTNGIIAASNWFVTELVPNGPYVGWQTIDRKSTRLNSSHGYISYAVFCLKK